MNKAVNLLQQYISNGQLDKSLVECHKLIQEYPNELYLKKLLSHIFSLKEDYSSAIETSHNILITNPKDFDCINNLGNFYLKIEEYLRAAEFIQQAKHINPLHPSPFQNQAELFMKSRKFEKAAEELDSCIELHEKYSDDYTNYKSSIMMRIEIFIALKQQDRAIDFIKKYLENKFDGELLLHLIQINKKLVSKDLITTCFSQTNTTLFGSSLEKFQKLVPLYFSLANYYEKIEPKKSEDYYIKANKEILEIQRMSMIKFQKSTLKIIEGYEKIHDLTIDDKNKGSKNIFILGMPRSGTTLTESLISANSEVFGAGELMSFYELSQKFTLGNDFSLKEMCEVGSRYVDRCSYFLNQGYGKIADKLPNNYHFIGHIRKFLPSAKIILILRDPWDVAISLFKQRYVANIPYSSSMFNIGIQIANFEAVILYWKSMGVLDQNLIIIKYEDLVNNFNEYQDKIYKFCNINGPYQEDKREGFFAKTASINQVQGKIHNSSVKKEDFNSLKEEFLEAFHSQRFFWKSKNIKPAENSYFEYNI